VARAARAKRQRVRNALLMTGLVVALIAGLVIAKVNTGHKANTAAPTTQAPASVVAAVESVPAASLARAATASPTGLAPISGATVTKDGKPLVLYVGAEYCPFCAAERWAMVTALSKFGTFHGLGATHSSSIDVYPDTATFSFHGATYTSPYLAFQGVETQTNQVQGSSYGALDTLTATQQNLLDTYDAPPHVSSSSAGTIPFILFGGKAVQSGASFSPSVLQGKTMSQIAAAMHDPSSDVAKAVNATAGAFVQRLCSLTGNKPANVCRAFTTS
jgi:hypothetical protein